MAEPTDIGTILSRGTATVERGRLKFFSKAIGEDNPIYSDESAARDAGYRGIPVPPTFLFCLNSEVSGSGNTLSILKLDLARILHAEQAFTYSKMVHADDVLQFETKVADVYDKKNGQLHFVVMETAVSDANGEAVAQLRCTLVERRNG
ncbi:MaoC family dehydratase N-terminal domain-containing protein [Achromobacter pestifer]|uniref:MaoC family dehydratase N-terminal domain-containing protein n=1 Tax=Achromobacter pestifer TaxID=1353889 RepID=A0A7D4E397_9BURK|nr:MaoC family dehydratase N-terminal domain-containing protein [Achromobacter pestifer]QKH38209.1 MaoC family dehydratase N-terminal domain-containing protein [Achromobacter pestifer]